MGTIFATCFPDLPVGLQMQICGGTGQTNTHAPLALSADSKAEAASLRQKMTPVVDSVHADVAAAALLGPSL